MNSITKIKEKTLQECLQELDEKKITEIYDNIPNELKSKKKKITLKEKREYIEDHITTTYPIISLTFTDYEMKNHQDIIDGKKISNISHKLLNNYFIFEEDDTYILPTEIKEIYYFCSTEKMQKEKYLLAISFYMEMNGVLEIPKLIELLKETGLKLTKKKILEYIKEKDFIVKKDIIYVNDLAEGVDEKVELLSLKNENSYKVYVLEEMLGTLAFIEEMNFEQKIASIIKEIKNKEIIEPLSNAIYNIIRIGYCYQEQIENIFIEEQIKLTKNKKAELDDLIADIYWNLPSWILNGYSESELSEESESDYFDYNEEIDFDDLSKEEKIEVYITTYMTINGVMETDVMLELLEVEHNIKVTLSEIKEIIKEIDSIIIKGKYIQVEGLEKEYIEEIMKYKNMLGQYKVIDDIDKMIDEIDEVDDELDEVNIKYNLSENVIWTIKSVMNLGGLDKEVLKLILESENCKMSSPKQKDLLKDLEKILKKLRIWTLNGYRKDELTKFNRKEKIGRNDPCICGSGKKYKKCCGK